VNITSPQRRHYPYTTDGSTPTETMAHSTPATPVNITSSTVLKAITYEAGFADSPVTGGLFTISPPQPPA